MDELIPDLLALVVVVGGGWVLGIVAFFKAMRALREVRALRLSLVQPPVAPPRPVVSVPEVIAPPPPSPEVEAPPPPPVEPPLLAPPRPSIDIEALLTLRWGVWLGAAALLLAGVFLIRYAVDAGLFGPAERCAMAALLGILLLAAAEWLRRLPPAAGPMRGDEAPAALAAGGAAVLFGAAYGAGPFYDLVPAPVAFALLAAAALAGLAASLRFGQLTAVVGVAGAFVTPALVQTEAPSLPGLFGYLLVVTAAALAVVRYSGWTWLGWAATVAGAVWVLFGATAATTADSWAPALFVPAASALSLLLMPPAALDFVVGRRLCWVPFATLGASGLVLEAVMQGTMPRLGILLLVPIAVAKGALEPRLDRLPWLASLLFLLALLLWALPEWQPTGEVMTNGEGVILAILPGAWAPEVIKPLLSTAAIVAGFLAAAGLWRERRAPNRLRWSALVAAVPVLTLAVTYAQVSRFQPDMAWAAAALALTAALIFTTWLGMQAADRQRAGVHAAGAAAALALACAILLHDHWLTLAVSLFLPVLAWIEAAADLPPLRRVALAVAALVLVRLLLNWYVLDYAFGTAPVANGLLLAYGVPAFAFALAAIMFRRRGDDLTVAVLEGGAVVFVSVLIALEIRHWSAAGELRGAGSFTEATLHVATLAVQATFYLQLAQRTQRKILDWAWRIEGVLALIGGGVLLVVNPAFFDIDAGSAALLAGYLVPALLAVLALRMVTRPCHSLVLGGYAILAGLAWIGLEIRELFHPGAMGWGVSPTESAELWAWSGAWLVYGAALMGLGIRRRDRTLRMTALAIIALVTAKTFLVDMHDLTGLWRVLSFLGLGLMLIALGEVYRRFVVPTTPKPAQWPSSAQHPRGARRAARRRRAHHPLGLPAWRGNRAAHPWLALSGRDADRRRTSRGRWLHRDRDQNASGSRLSPARRHRARRDEWRRGADGLRGNRVQASGCTRVRLKRYWWRWLVWPVSRDRAHQAENRNDTDVPPRPRARTTASPTGANDNPVAA